MSPECDARPHSEIVNIKLYPRIYFGSSTCAMGVWGEWIVWGLDVVLRLCVKIMCVGKKSGNECVSMCGCVELSHIYERDSTVYG